MTNEADNCRKFVLPKLQAVASTFVHMVVGGGSMRQRKTHRKQSPQLALEEEWALIEAAVQRRNIVRGEAGNEGV
ncbi:MAG: hypothetical protein AB7F74_16610 [Parvibaculaceae bacterium]